MDVEPTQTNETAEVQQGKPRKKLLIIIGAVVFGVVVIALLATYFVSKSNADTRAADYENQLKAYVASLSTKDGKTLDETNKSAPKLEAAAFSFVSADYQQASAKQAAVNEDLKFIKDVSSGNEYLKKDIRRSIFYDQSSFFFDRYSARTDRLLEFKSGMSDKAYAAMVIKQYNAEAKAAKAYLKKLENPVNQPLHTSEITKLRQTLEAFIDKTEACVKTAKETPAKAEPQAADCNKHLNRYYYDTVVHYDYIGYFPYGLKTKPVETLLATLKEHQTEAYADTTLDQAKLQAIIDTRVALIKTLLPTTTKDKAFGPKADIVRVFNGQIADAVEAADTTAEDKSAYKQKLSFVTASLTMYDNPKGAKDGPDDAGGFVGELSGILSATEPRSNYDEGKAMQHHAHYKKQLANLKKLKTPEYVKDEMKVIIAVYEDSLKFFKESDELSKKSVEADKLADEDSNDSLKYAIEAYKYIVQSNDKYYEGQDVLDKANSAVAKIGNKIDDTATMTKQVIKQYDDLLAVGSN